MTLPPASIIKRHLNGHGYEILSHARQHSVDPALDTLALLIAFHFPAYRELLHHVRGNVREKPGFYHDLGGSNSTQQRPIKDLCGLLRCNGVLSEYRWDKRTARIFGIVAENPRAMNFLTGGWLERCLAVHVGSFLNLEAHRVEMLHNVKVMRPGRREFEMDMVLAVDGTLYWWEAKSGGYDETHLQRYRGVATELKLTPRQHFLVLARTEDGSDPAQTGKRIGFSVIGPHQISAHIWGIEERHRVNGAACGTVQC